MPPVSADAWFWLGLVNARDAWSRDAQAAAEHAAERKIITTAEVLIEVLNALSGMGESMRLAGAQLVRGLMQMDETQVEPGSTESFPAGLALYEQRRDKQYSLVDCISMTTMRRLGIDEVLTGDHHFAQEGFSLLR
ncbi:MAG: type II toxin-antitoxin system VapC family toxin [Dehalococcoidia bacterium]